jgi:type I restriction enzyme S subunit
MLRFIEDRANPRYMAYLMSLPSFRLFVEEGLSVGATKQQELNLEALRAYNVTLLPLRQQGLVADFLDRKCARTRQLVGEIDAFISLTESASIEVVRRLVTGAHESDLVPVSGDWFTTIPRDWTVKPLGLVAKFDNGVAFKPEDWGSEGRPIIRIEHLNGAPLVHRTHRAVLKRAEIRTDDLLFAWSGNRGTSFGPHRWTGESPALLNQHIFKVSSQEDLGWLYWVLRAATLYVEEQAHGIIGMVHITKRRLTKIRVPVPPRIIQVELAKRLDDDSARQWLLRREFAALKEQLVSYRDAQIVEAVTGGLPVEQVSERPGLASTAAER